MDGHVLEHDRGNILGDLHSKLPRGEQVQQAEALLRRPPKAPTSPSASTTAAALAWARSHSALLQEGLAHAALLQEGLAGARGSS